MVGQGKYWLLTIPHASFVPYLPQSCVYIKGQLEKGAQEGYLHWQVLVIFERKVRLAKVREVFGDVHSELTRSAAAEDYVWKEETRVEGTQFVLGEKPFQRNSKTDWNRVKALAQEGKLDDIDAQIYVCHYSSLKRIASDAMVPTAMEREVFVYWGPTGVGKSRKVWELAGLDAYPKDPNTKFWDGYRHQEVVVIDEFRGVINISHMLRWLDRYPVIVEVKGSSIPFKAKKIYITSNLDPRCWYPDLDQETKDALLRRLNIIHCPLNLY